MESKQAALRAAQTKHSSTEAQFKAAHAQLQEATQQLDTLKQKLQEGLSRLYNQQVSLISLLQACLPLFTVSHLLATRT